VAFNQDVKKYSNPRELDSVYFALKSRAVALGFHHGLWPDIIAAMLDEIEESRRVAKTVEGASTDVRS
jgi:hypothetical protein